MKQRTRAACSPALSRSTPNTPPPRNPLPPILLRAKPRSLITENPRRLRSTAGKFRGAHLWCNYFSRQTATSPPLTIIPSRLYPQKYPGGGLSASLKNYLRPRTTPVRICRAHRHHLYALQPKPPVERRKTNPPVLPRDCVMDWMLWGAMKRVSGGQRGTRTPDILLVRQAL